MISGMRSRSGSLWASLTMLVVLMLGAFGSSATNYDFLRNAPFSYFNEDDKRVFSEHLAQALSEAKDNETRTWSNPKTKSHGEITPLNTRAQANAVCRDVSVANTAGGRTNKGRYTFCKREGEQWKMRM
jgi:surface antigen